MATELTSPAHEAPPDPIIIRELPPAEYERLRGVGLFEIFALPNMEHTIPIVGQNARTGEIEAYWLVFDAVHVEPLWIAEKHRKKAGFARRLWGAVQSALVARNVPIAFACIADNDAAQNLPQATRLGFKKIPGSLYFVEVKPEGEAAEGWKSAGEQLLDQIRVKQEGGGSA